MHTIINIFQVEEEALQGEKRRLAIERANKMLYDSTDRVKALHSKLLMTDVLQERVRLLNTACRTTPPVHPRPCGPPPLSHR